MVTIDNIEFIWNPSPSSARMILCTYFTIGYKVQTRWTVAEYDFHCRLKSEP